MAPADLKPLKKARNAVPAVKFTDDTAGLVRHLEQNSEAVVNNNCIRISNHLLSPHNLGNNKSYLDCNIPTTGSRSQN